MTRVKFRELFVLALSVAVAGCSTDFPVAPTEPTPVVITEPAFTGTLAVNGAANQPFTATASGNVELLIVSLADSNGPAAIGPTGTIRVGLQLGTWNGTGCSVPAIYNENAFVATVVTGGATGAGNLCARISNKHTEPVTFEITITHF